LKLSTALVPGVAVFAMVALLLAQSVASAAIRIDDLTVQEGDSSHSVGLPFVDDGPATSTRCVSFSGTSADVEEPATVQQDFAFPASFSACLAPGQTEGSIPLTVLGDTTREPDEQLGIALSAAGGPVEFTDRRAVLTIANDDGVTVSGCILYAESKLALDVKSAAASLQRLGILGLLSTGRKPVGPLLFCGNGKIQVTVRYGRAIVAKGVFQGKYPDRRPVHGDVRLARTHKTGRLKGLRRARLKVTVRISDSKGDSIAGSRKVTIGLRGSGGRSPRGGR
jgi:hypothetical protein